MESEDDSSDESILSHDTKTMSSKLRHAVTSAIVAPPAYAVHTAMTMLLRRGKLDDALKLCHIIVRMTTDPFIKADALISLGQCHRNRRPGDLDLACQAFRDGKAQIASLHESDRRTRWLLRATTQLGDTMAHMRRFSGQPEMDDIIREAEDLLRQVRDLDARAIKKRAVKKKRSKNTLDILTMSMAELGEMYYYTGRWGQGEALLRELVPILVEKLGTHDEKTIEAQRDLASMLVNQDKHEEAEAAYRVARKWNARTPTFGPEEQAAIDYNIAMCLSEQGKHAEAKQALRHIDLAVDLLHYANGEWTLKLVRSTLLHLGDYEEVARLCRRFQHVLDGKVTVFGPLSQAAMRNMTDHITALLRLRRYNEAIPVLRDRLDRETRDPRLTVYSTRWTHVRLALALHNAQFPDEAIFHYRKCLEMEREAVPRGQSECFVRNILKYLAYTYEVLQDKQQALLAYSELQSIYFSQPAKPSNIWSYQWARGKMFTLQGKWDHAVRLLLGPPSFKFGYFDPALFNGADIPEQSRLAISILLKQHTDIGATCITSETEHAQESRSTTLPTWPRSSASEAARGSTTSLTIQPFLEAVESVSSPGWDVSEQQIKHTLPLEHIEETSTQVRGALESTEIDYTVHAAKQAALGALGRQLHSQPAMGNLSYADFGDEGEEQDEEQVDEDNEDDADDENAPPSVCALLARVGYRYPWVPNNDEKRLQLPHLPQTYQEMVRQRRIQEERLRYPWRVELGIV